MNGLVAQLDRASPSGGEGRAFESRRAHHERKSSRLPFLVFDCLMQTDVPTA